MASKKSAATKKSTGGRPRSERPLRYQLKYKDGELEAWRVAAATCGLTFGDWAVQVLNAEAIKAVHVPMVTRKK